MPHVNDWALESEETVPGHSEAWGTEVLGNMLFQVDVCVICYLEQPCLSPASVTGIGKLGAESSVLTFTASYSPEVFLWPKVDAEYRKWWSVQKPPLPSIYAWTMQANTECRGCTLALSTYTDFEICYLFRGGEREESNKQNNKNKQKKTSQMNKPKTTAHIPHNKIFWLF